MRLLAPKTTDGRSWTPICWLTVLFQCAEQVVSSVGLTTTSQTPLVVAGALRSTTGEAWPTAARDGHRRRRRRSAPSRRPRRARRPRSRPPCSRSSLVPPQSEKSRMYCVTPSGHVGSPELRLVDRERDHVQPPGRDLSVGRGRLHHQQPLDVAERIRLGQVPQRVARLGLDPRRVGVRDPDEHLVRALGRAAQVLEVAVVKRLEPPVDHPAAHGLSRRRRRRPLRRGRRGG